MTKVLIKKIQNKISWFHQIWTSTILHRDLLFIRALTKYPVSNKFFFGRQIPVSISEPNQLISELPSDFQDKLGVYSPAKKYCNIFEDTQILGGDFPIVLSSEGKPLWNTIAYQFFNFERYYTPIKWFLQSHSNTKYVEAKQAMFLYSTWSSNYFHWLLDNLARLQFLDFLDEDIRQEIKVLVGGNLSTFQLSSLLALGLKNIEYIGKDNYNVNSLFVPNFSLEQQGYDLDQIIWLRNKIFQNTKEVDLENKNSRILILRKSTSGRSFTNQAEVIDALSPLGFTALYLEEVSFASQVSLFKQAEYIVAAHGAGLANIIFSETATIVEIFGQEVFPCYFQLAKTLGLNYCFLQCNNERLDKFDNKQNLLVDVTLLLKLIPNLSI
jgi:Glycosyltransferase 61